MRCLLNPHLSQLIRRQWATLNCSPQLNSSTHSSFVYKFATVAPSPLTSLIDSRHRHQHQHEHCIAASSRCRSIHSISSSNVHHHRHRRLHRSLKSLSTSRNLPSRSTHPQSINSSVETLNHSFSSATEPDARLFPTKSIWSYDSQLTVGAWESAKSKADRFDEIERELMKDVDENATYDNNRMIAISGEQALLSRINSYVKHIETLRASYKQSIALIHDTELAIAKLKSTQSSVSDDNRSSHASSLSESIEMLSLAREEASETLTSLHQYEGELLERLLPGAADDCRGVILEVQSGVGGDEAAIFARELFQMYSSYSTSRGWAFEPVTITKSDAGHNGYRSATAKITSSYDTDPVYGSLKYESGCHRVQRVPETEAKGRVHTSAASVYVLPQVDETEVDINEKDMKFSFHKSSGCGGQHVNTTDSAVRVIHLPTGLTVNMQDERCQHTNKAKAITILKSRIYELHRRRELASAKAVKSTIATSGDRSDRIRTYNFPQQRVTDHRIGLTKHDLNSMMLGEILDQFILECRRKERQAQIQAFN